jgi:putative hydrolase of the HAD superfamily
LIEGVEETLADLAQRHELALFTKGHPEEQRMKVDRSGLARFFGHTGIVKEKDAQAYARLVREQGFHLENTWMIGNSPKSDINPALQAGLGAVLVPHAHTWVLEHQDVRAPEGSRFLEVQSFADLRRHF